MAVADAINAQTSAITSHLTTIESRLSTLNTTLGGLGDSFDLLTTAVAAFNTALHTDLLGLFQPVGGTYLILYVLVALLLAYAILRLIWSVCRNFVAL